LVGQKLVRHQQKLRGPGFLFFALYFNELIKKIASGIKP